MASKSLKIIDSKDAMLSGWGYEYGLLEKIFFDAKTSTTHLSSGVTVCKARSKIPLHYHNCETFHYILYGSGIVKDYEGNENEIRQGVTIYSGPGKEGAHTFENNDDFPLAILWVHAYPEGIRESTTWM